jgi:hypothetical protein
MSLLSGPTPDRSAPPNCSETKSKNTTYYQTYLIGRDGHYIKAVDLTRADDDAAKKRALKMVDGHDVELWHYARRIAKFSGERE